jgi:hypothetical protein
MQLDGDGVHVATLADADDLPGASHPIVSPGVELAKQQRELDDLPQMHHRRGLEEDPDLADVTCDTGAGVELDGNDDVIATRLTAVGLVRGPHGRRL